MRQMEDALRQLTDLFLSGELTDLLMNLFLVAATAAFVEEIFQGSPNNCSRGGSERATWRRVAADFQCHSPAVFGFFPVADGAVLGYLFLFVTCGCPCSITLLMLCCRHHLFCGENNFPEQWRRSPDVGSYSVMIASGVLTYFIFTLQADL